MYKDCCLAYFVKLDIVEFVLNTLEAHTLLKISNFFHANI